MHVFPKADVLRARNTANVVEKILMTVSSIVFGVRDRAAFHGGHGVEYKASLISCRASVETLTTVMRR